MEALAAGRPGIAHPDGERLMPPPGRQERIVGWLFAGTGLALFAAMGLLGLTMRLTQADAVGVSPEWFYRLMTLHGAGMLAGAMLAMMGGLWFAIRPSVPLGFGRMLASYAAIVTGAVAIVVAVVIGGFAAGWTFLSPLPFSAAGAWSTWAAAAFLGGLVLVGVGFFVFCIDVLSGATRAYGTFGRAIGLRFLRGRDDDPPPPQVIAATVVTTQGMLASAVGTTILLALLGKTIDGATELDALWAKNLTYFFGHSFANLIIYLAVGMIYVLLPRYAGRPWKTTKPLAFGWMATLVLVTTAYSHHLYMDFVQPGWAQGISTISSSAAALPVAVVTIYTGMMLVWGSRYRWTLASILIYLGFAGWAIGGMGAVIDSVIPVNFRFHNTLWVPAHFHTYLMVGVIFWVMAFLAHMFERAAGRPASRLATIGAPAAMALGGYGLVGAWYASGALGVPRRIAVHPAGTEGYSVFASVAVVIFAAGFLLLLYEFARLWRESRRAEVRPGRAPPAIAGASEEATAPPVAPLVGPVQLGTAVGLAVVCAFAFLPDVSEASEQSIQSHHLAHAAEFLFGAVLGLAIACTPSVYRRLAPRFSTAGMALAILAPAAMLLAMIPAIYEPLEGNDMAHAAFHGGIALLGMATGFGAALLGRVVGRLMLVLSVGMALMYAAGVTGG
ncbi:MAG TPA: cbb3-type cytochrome c oxidase subunit I [Solirubrobacterales bacterium]